MIKIDLHMHSQYSSINGDKIQFDSIMTSLMSLKNNNVKIASFTDHNTFSSKLFNEATLLANKLGIVIFPGVEVDVVRSNGMIGHILLIADPTIDVKEFEQFVRKNFGKRKITTDAFFDVIKGQKFIIIPHVGKSDNFEFHDLENYVVDAIETTNLDNPKLLKYNKESNNRDTVVAFSDTHAWNKYPQNDNVFTYVEPIKNFDELKKCLQDKCVKLGNKYKHFE